MKILSLVTILALLFFGCSPIGPSDNTNDASSSVCGDGVVQGAEECDLSDQVGLTCADFGLGSGDLACTDACVVDLSGCSGCGNDVCEPEENLQTCPQDCGAKRIAVGAGLSCAVLKDGASYCWGGGTSGQLGNGLFENTIVPVRTQLDDTAELVSAAGVHACAINVNNGLYCWGEGSIIGDPNAVTTAVPREIVEAGEVQDVSAGTEGGCAVSSAGSVYCWGSGSMSGIGTSDHSYSPVHVQSLPGTAQQISCGASHCCALLDDGEVWCWGSNSNEQLGISGVGESLLPTQADVQGNIVQVEAGSHHTCSLDSDGRVNCWGANQASQCGLPSSGNPVPPQNEVVLGEAAAKISAGSLHTCVVTVLGSAWCWGGYEWNEYHGQLGHGGTESSDSPVRVYELSNATDISAGESHTCAVSAGQIYCWGSNNYGELGTSESIQQSLIPVLVEFQ